MVPPVSAGSCPGSGTGCSAGILGADGALGTGGTLGVDGLGADGAPGADGVFGVDGAGVGAGAGVGGVGSSGGAIVLGRSAIGRSHVAVNTTPLPKITEIMISDTRAPLSLIVYTAPLS